MEITNDEGLPVVYDGVGKVTMEKSLGCLKMRGTLCLLEIHLESLIP